MKLLYFHTGSLDRKKANNIQALQMCKAFAQLGHHVTLAVSLQHPNLPEATASVCETLALTSLPFDLRLFRCLDVSPKIHSVRAALAFSKAVREIPHDVTFARNPVLFPLICRSCAPIIFESHDKTCMKRLGLLDFIWRRRIVALSQSRDMVLFVTISKALAEWWRNQGVPTEKLCALHDGVDAAMFTANLSMADARKITGLPQNVAIVLYAGSLYRNRGIENVLRLAEARQDALFVMVGGPDAARRNLEKRSALKRRSNVRFIGAVPHNAVPNYLASANVLLMIWSREVPTIEFCSPLKLFEYMAAQRIIVGHKFPTIEEVVEDGKHAYLADPDSFDELKCRLDIALDAPSDKMPQAARDLVMSKYTWEERCRQILSRLPA